MALRAQIVLVGSLLALLGCGADPVVQDDSDARDGASVGDGDAQSGSSRSDAGASRSDGGSSRSESGVAAGGDKGNDSDAVLPAGGKAFGEWTYYEVDGAVCRDGSPAGYYIRTGTSKNLMIFLNGGGVCYDDFFCAINPENVNSSLPGETLIAAVLDIGTSVLEPVRQVPPETGIFKKDPKNPVADWSMVYVPYCTGDVYGGTKANAMVPGTSLPPQQFVGYHNVGRFLDHFGPMFKGKADQVLLTGSSAGGFGSLLNFDRTQTYFGDATEVLTMTDSGVPFDDDLLEPCLQKNWRNLWGLDDALPKDCEGCFNADGGGLARGLGNFIFNQKYKGRMLGGGISSKQDEIIKLFFSSGLKDCTVKAVDEAVPAAIGLGSYPADRYPAGLKQFIEDIAGHDNVGSYIMEGTLHQHIFRDRYYAENGVGMTIADFVGKLLDGEPVHVGKF